MARKNTTKREAACAEAKRKCRLNADTVRMAKELGLNPRSLIKNIPRKAEPWKKPVHVWIREIYEKRGLQADSRAIATTEGRQKSARGRPVSQCRPHGGGTPRTTGGRVVNPGRITSEPYSDGDGLGEDPFSFCGDGGCFDAGELSEEEIAAESESMLQRREHFRAAAERVAAALSDLPFVRKIILFGSVAAPLAKEAPRFWELRRAGIAVWHECRDVDLAVWLDDLSDLRRLQRARSRALDDLLRDLNIGVAHHQVEVFLFDADADRYDGRLCCFAQCPKGKPECDVLGCGATPFLQQHVGFTFRSDALAADRTKVLYDRDAETGGEAGRNEVPFLKATKATEPRR